MAEWRQVIISMQEPGKGSWFLQKFPYEISQHGVVRRIAPGPSTHAGKVLKTFYSKGYEEYVSLSYQGRIEHYSIRALITETWEGDAASLHVGRLETKEVEPLELDRPKGEDHWNSRLTVAEIHEIRRIYQTAKKRYGLLRKLADRYGISRNHVWLIGNGHRGFTSA